MTVQQIIMYFVGALLIYLAIKKQMEPTLLLPMGFGAILVNLPNSGVVHQNVEGIGEVTGIIQWIHEGVDDFTTQPSGNSGAKIACGVIERLRNM